MDGVFGLGSILVGTFSYFLIGPIYLWELFAFTNRFVAALYKANISHSGQVLFLPRILPGYKLLLTSLSPGTRCRNSAPDRSS